MTAEGPREGDACAARLTTNGNFRPKFFARMLAEWPRMSVAVAVPDRSRTDIFGTIGASSSLIFARPGLKSTELKGAVVDNRQNRKLAEKGKRPAQSSYCIVGRNRLAEACEEIGPLATPGTRSTRTALLVPRAESGYQRR